MNAQRRIATLLGLAALGVLAYLATRRQATERGADPAAASSANPPGAGGSTSAAGLHYVGREACAACHEKELELWQGSDHDLAMQEATPATVLGDFGGASFTYHGVTSTFTRKGDAYFVRTDGPDGALTDYPIAYTFGVDPLQQYLIEFPGGRIQALNVCWDTRPKEQGGQRWFHLYPDENVAHDDILHWTGPYQNWNHMCAECHSTDVHKGYDAQKDTFRTTWSELDVSCEACHGPGSAHVDWARAQQSGSGSVQAADFELVARLGEGEPATWVMDPATGIAKRERPRTSWNEVEACARCHARRSLVHEDWQPGRPLMDTHRVALLSDVLYEHDGQIKEEVYEYGSFLQSKMYAAGVTCSDCHNPHSLDPAPGNTACAKCHAPQKFDSPEHHHHDPGGPGARCVDCHMPTRDYMVVDTRHDHSFRVPRPDLSLKLGTPNACNACHTDKGPAWAAGMAKQWWGEARAQQPHYGEALCRGNQNLPGAADALVGLADDAQQPAIARASAVALLREYLGPQTIATVAAATRDPDPLVREAAVAALRQADPSLRIGLLATLLEDPVRTIRVDAGRAIAEVPANRIPPAQRAIAARALQEWFGEQALNADRAESHMNLGALHAGSGAAADAEREYEIARKLSPRFPDAYLNLADLYREEKREADAERVLRAGLEVAPQDPHLSHALGLALVRQSRLTDALPLLERAGKDDPHYAYVYGVALQSSGENRLALESLERAHERFPGDPELLYALATFHRDFGDRAKAIEFARRLALLRPDDPNARKLYEEIQNAGK